MVSTLLIFLKRFFQPKAYYNYKRLLYKFFLIIFFFNFFFNFFFIIFLYFFFYFFPLYYLIRYFNYIL